MIFCTCYFWGPNHFWKNHVFTLVVLGDRISFMDFCGFLYRNFMDVLWFQVPSEAKTSNNYRQIMEFRGVHVEMEPKP